MKTKYSCYTHRFFFLHSRRVCVFTNIHIIQILPPGHQVCDPMCDITFGKRSYTRFLSLVGSLPPFFFLDFFLVVFSGLKEDWLRDCVVMWTRLSSRREDCCPLNPFTRPKVSRFYFLKKRMNTTHEVGAALDSQSASGTASLHSGKAHNQSAFKAGHLIWFTWR